MAGGLNALGNLLGKVNANGALVVALDGGTASATTMTVDTLKLSIANPDVVLVREAAGHSFQRNSTNAQRASWANTYTSSTNNEAFSIDWQTTANNAIVGTRTAATGTARNMRFVAQQGNAGTAYTTIGLDPGSAPLIRLSGFATAALGGVSTGLTGNVITALDTTTFTATSGTIGGFAILPTYNQSSGTAANTDLLINRTETAVGSGAQSLISAQVGGVGKFGVGRTGFLWHTRTESAESTDSNVTYTAAQILGGIITRSNMSSNRVDAFPTAANLVAAIPGCAVGTSFDVIINNNDTAQTLTVNGASTGITYEGAATALAATECRLFRVLITNITGSSEAATVFQIV